MSTEEAAPAPLPAAGESVPAAPPPNAPAPAPRSERRRRPLLEWFWRGHALRDAHESVAAERARYGIFEDRARTAAEFGRRALEPGLARAAGSADALGSELYMQAAYWALLALTDTNANTPPNKLPFDLTAAMALADRELLLGAAGGALSLDEVERAAALGDYFDAKRTEQARIALLLQKFAENLLAALSRKEQRVWLLRAQRLTRLSIIAVAFAAVFGTTLLGLDWVEQRRDLARDKAWHASSTAVSACNSPAQFCDESPDYFFHTAEEKNPSLEIDLGAALDFSAVRIINRRDCCRERASPLVVEASTDQKNWRELGRHEGTFSSFKLKFPTTHARYIRVRIPGSKPMILHLAAVRVLP